MKTLSLKLPEELDAKLAEIAREKDVSKSSLVREAIAEYIVGPPVGGLFLEAAGDLVGCVSAPEDLSMNPAYLEGLGD